MTTNCDAKALEIARAHYDRRTWIADDGNAEVEVECEDRSEAAQEYVDDGDWGSESASSWITVYTYPRYYVGDTYVDDTDDRESATVTIAPTEPDCVDGEHDWQSPLALVGGIKENPGVWGHGGGVIIDECCVRCGCGRKTDTWAQDRSTGAQGLTSVSYETGKYDVLPAALVMAMAELRANPDAAAELAGECGGIVEAAGYVLLAARDDYEGISDSTLSAIPRAERDALHAACEYVARVYRAVGRDDEARACRLAIWFVACAVDSGAAYTAAHAVRAVLS